MDALEESANVSDEDALRKLIVDALISSRESVADVYTAEDLEGMAPMELRALYLETGSPLPVPLC